MNEMIERVARAICFSRQSCEWCKVACLASRAELEKSPQWTKALAAIGAMRDPTDAMLNATTPIAGENPGARDIWRDMIDAALK